MFKNPIHRISATFSLRKNLLSSINDPLKECLHFINIFKTICARFLVRKEMIIGKNLFKVEY